MGNLCTFLILLWTSKCSKYSLYEWVNCKCVYLVCFSVIVKRVLFISHDMGELWCVCLCWLIYPSIDTLPPQLKLVRFYLILINFREAHDWSSKKTEGSSVISGPSAGVFYEKHLVRDIWLSGGIDSFPLTPSHWWWMELIQEKCILRGGSGHLIPQMVLRCYSWLSFLSPQIISFVARPFSTGGVVCSTVKVLF